MAVAQLPNVFGYMLMIGQLSKGISDIETKSEQYELPITMLHTPNPVQDKLTVRLNRFIPGSIFTITDVNGQTIFLRY